MTDDERAEVAAIFEALREAEARDEVTALAERFAAQASDTARARARRVHADPPTPDEKGRYWWAEVEPALVAASTLTAAHVGLGVAVVELGIPEPELHWMVPETDADRVYVDKWGWRDWMTVTSLQPVLGVAFPGVVWLDARLPPRNALRVCLHECQHVSDYLTMGDAFDLAESERRAAEFEARVEEIWHAT